MADSEFAEQTEAQARSRRILQSTWARVAKYVAVRTASLLVMFIIGMYLVVVVCNLGGYIDQIYRDRIDGAVLGTMLAMKEGTIEERQVIADEIKTTMTEAYGLNKPFLLRCLRGTYSAMALEFVTPEIAAALPNTMLLVVASYLLLFFLATFLALYLSRRYESLIDRLVTALSPLSAAPSWVHGIVLVSLFAVQLRLLPFNGMLDNLPPDNKIAYALVVAKHMVLPVAAILLSLLFQCVYGWRTFFLLHSSEDYVEMAQAKGLPNKIIERRYILRPTLPYFITSFSLLLLGFWQEAIALEYFFYWPGIGRLYIESIQSWFYKPTTAIGIAVIFAYLLAASIFVLDIVYALVDPRIRIEGRQAVGRPTAAKKTGRRFWPERRKDTPSVDRRLARPGTGPEKWGKPAAARRKPSVRQEPLLRNLVRDIIHYPSAMLGLAIIAGLAVISIYAVTAIPYDQAVQVWETGSGRISPRGALPTWVNWFRRDPLPETVLLNSQDGTTSKETRQLTDEMTAITISMALDYEYTTFPQDLMVNMAAHYGEKLPFVSMTWRTPDGRKIDLGKPPVTSAYSYVVSQDSALAHKLKTQYPVQGLFTTPSASEPVALPGRYELQIKAFFFEPNSDLNAQLVLYGQVYGLAGTDMDRRDLTVVLLWGTPVALCLGLFGAVSSTLIAITIAAIGVWFGGWIDRLIQRVSEINMLLPVMPLAIMIYFRYSKRIWVILGVIIILSSFGRSLKNFRAALLQVREEPYIEAALSYGASNWRIILRYLVPRVIPVLVPQLVIMIPGFVFLEATLSLLGVSDLYLPTWGKVIYDAVTSGVLQTHYYWLLEPIALLLITGLAFAMVGYSLDRIFNPRLRSMQSIGK